MEQLKNYSPLVMRLIEYEVIKSKDNKSLLPHVNKN